MIDDYWDKVFKERKYYDPLRKEQMKLYSKLNNRYVKSAIVMKGLRLFIQILETVTLIAFVKFIVRGKK